MVLSTDLTAWIKLDSYSQLDDHATWEIYLLSSKSMTSALEMDYGLPPVCSSWITNHHQGCKLNHMHIASLSFLRCRLQEMFKRRVNYYVEGIISFFCFSNAFNLLSKWQIWHACEMLMWSTMKAWKTCKDCDLILSFLSTGLQTNMHLVKRYK